MARQTIQGFFLGGGVRRLVESARPLAHRLVPDSRGTEIAKPAPGPPSPIHPKTLAQRFGGNGSFDIDPVQVGLARNGGKKLPPALLTKMEAAFGTDFSAVRVHVGPQAARIGAIAFTTGNDLYFAPGRFQPESVQGQQLIGHELAHVVQQRQGRVRAPGSGVAVVQDHALEAEADRLGQKAAMHVGIAQRKAALPAQVRVSAPRSAGPGSYRITAGAGGREVGTVMTHDQSGNALKVTDLFVDPAHRDGGIGRMLLASAARSGQRLGKGTLRLAAQDNGSGKLVRWYREMGFSQVGRDARGHADLEAPIARILASNVQRCVDPRHRHPIAHGHAPALPIQARTVQRSTLGFEELTEPTGYGSVSLSATINGIDIGKAWSVQKTFTEDTEHAEDALVDFVQSLYLYSEFPSGVGKDVDLTELIKIMQSIQKNGLNIVINNLTASPCSSEFGTCKKKNLDGCAERLIAMMKDYKNAKISLTVNADHYYQPTGVGGGAKDLSKKAVKAMTDAGITVNIAKK